MNCKKAPNSFLYKNYLLFLFLFAALPGSFGQPPEKAFIKLTNPYTETVTTSTSQQFIVGSTCKTCNLLVNRERVKVYATGAFAHEERLSEGDSSFTLVSIDGSGKSVSKNIRYTYTAPTAAEPVRSLGIEYIRTLPEGDLVLLPGDKIQFRVKALPGCRVTTMQGTALYEQPGSMPGIYQGSYEVTNTDSFTNKRIPVTVIDSSGQSITKETTNGFSVMSPAAPDVALTTGRLAHLEYGLGDDRLGGAKMGYIDSLVVLKIIGKVGTDYKIRLAKTRTAYIPEDLVTLAPKGSFEPYSLTGKWRVYGDADHDYVSIELGTRLPYQSFQLLDPSRIVVDIFGATNNTNWITKLENAREIAAVDYEQVADDIFRVYITLRHKQHWGHQVFYRGNNLVIKVKHQPHDLSINKLTIAIDAGHGGTNTGAIGPTGVAEKTLTLELSQKIQLLLEAKGAKVIMTRSTESFFDNKERILFYRDSMPDLLISIHLNSSSDPIRTGGTATFYRYIGFSGLSHAIYLQMLKLGLKEYGCNSSFNFMLNSPTEYPNTLVEALFLSNPEEEEKILDQAFQQKMAQQIVQGIADFLKACE